jgi:putative spermidine/putrescine transport system permease protein
MKSSRPAIAIFLVLTTIPLLAGLGYSLLYSLGLAGLLGKGFTMEHWSALLADKETWQSLGYTTWLSLLSLVFAVLPALWMAHTLQFRHFSRAAFRSLFIPLSFPPLIAAFAIYHLLSPSGFLSRIAFQLGLIGQLEDFPRMVNDAGSIGILLVHVLLVFPFFSLVFYNTSQKERGLQLRDVSRSLGGSDRQFALKVWVPLMLKRNLGLLVLYGIFLFGAYEVPLLLGRSSPRTITLLVVDKVSKYDLAGIPKAHALVVLYALLVGLVATWLQWNRSRRLKA